MGVKGNDGQKIGKQQKLIKSQKKYAFKKRENYWA